MRKQTLFNDGWLFEMPGNEAVEVCLPHTWNGIDGQDGGDDYKRLACKYTKKFSICEGGYTNRLIFCNVPSEVPVIFWTLRSEMPFRSSEISFWYWSL